VGTSLISLVYWRILRREPAALPPQGNPSELRAALIFAALYAIVLISTAAARERFGAGGLYVVATLSGLTDMDAITLSASDLVTRDRIAPDLGWRLIIVASLANLIFKTGVVVALGSRALLKRIVILFGLTGLLGAAVLFFYDGPR
jgi:uncharacterized membrane protein (DUF4010 family)